MSGSASRKKKKEEERKKRISRERTRKKEEKLGRLIDRFPSGSVYCESGAAVGKWRGHGDGNRRVEERVAKRIRRVAKENCFLDNGGVGLYFIW